MKGRENGPYAIIPARIGSTRLPRKALLEISGRPLVVHAYSGTLGTGIFSRVWVATDSHEIKAAVEAHGGEAVLTQKRHPSGTDRVAECARILGLSKDAVIVNVQGDQPVVHRDTVKAIVDHLLAHPHCPMATPVCPMDPGEVTNPNRVKVVVGARGQALYFSRAPIPFSRDGEGDVLYLRHIGIYGYRNWFLQEFVGLPQGRLEAIEKLEQLRVLEYGFEIGVVEVKDAPLDVDTEGDLDRLRHMF